MNIFSTAQQKDTYINNDLSVLPEIINSQYFIQTCNPWETWYSTMEQLNKLNFSTIHKEYFFINTFYKDVITITYHFHIFQLSSNF